MQAPRDAASVASHFARAFDNLGWRMTTMPVQLVFNTEEENRHDLPLSGQAGCDEEQIRPGDCCRQARTADQRWRAETYGLAIREFTDCFTRGNCRRSHNSSTRGRAGSAADQRRADA